MVVLEPKDASSKTHFGVRSRAPLRISFGGGGTDVPPYPESHGGVVLSATINKYAYCTVTSAKRKGYGVKSADMNLERVYPALQKITYGDKLDFAKAVLRTMSPKMQRNFDMYLSTDAVPGSGLGSSSALMVAVVRGVTEYLGLDLSTHEIAESACVLEREELELKGGLQDQYAAAFGGFNFMEFGKSEVVVNPLRLKPEIIGELHSGLILMDMGMPRISSSILSKQIAHYEREAPEVMESLRRIKSITSDMKAALLKGELRRFGELIGEEWSYKKRLESTISNTMIDRLFREARVWGAVGGKVTGAGNGGHALFFVEFERRRDFIRHFEEEGFRVVPFGFDDGGVYSWKLNEGGVVI